MRVVVLLVCAALAAAADGKVFQRCDFARTIKAAGLGGFGGVSLADWVCMARWVSAYDSAAVNVNAGGGTSYGIFQLSSRWWCDDSKTLSANLCKVKCQKLLSHDISLSVACAKIVLRQRGMGAWGGWKRHCRGQDLSQYLVGCGV
ncbi:lysozyme [Arapaima gigas]